MPPPRNPLAHRTPPLEPWFVVKVTDASATVTTETGTTRGYKFDEWQLEGDNTFRKKTGGRVATAKNLGIALAGAFAVGDFALVRSADGAGGQLWEMLPLNPGGFFARLTSVAGGRWNFFPLTLSAAGVYVDDGPEVTGYTAVPLSIDGVTLPKPKSGLRVWMHPSKQSPFNEFLPLKSGTDGSGADCGPGCGWIAAANSLDCFTLAVVSALGQCGCAGGSLNLTWGGSGWTSASKLTICGVDYTALFFMDSDGEPALTLTSSGSGATTYRLSLDCCGDNSALFSGGNYGTNTGPCTDAADCPDGPAGNVFQVLVQWVPCPNSGYAGAGWYCVGDSGAGSPCASALSCVQYFADPGACVKLCAGPFTTEALCIAGCTGGGTGGFVACCSRHLNAKLYVYLPGGQGVVTLTWDGTAYWTGSTALTCGGNTLYLRYGLDCGLEYNCVSAMSVIWALAAPITSTTCPPPFTQAAIMNIDAADTCAGCSISGTVTITEQTPTTYNCVSGSCVSVSGTGGTYATLSGCLAACGGGSSITFTALGSASVTGTHPTATIAGVTVQGNATLWLGVLLDNPSGVAAPTFAGLPMALVGSLGLGSGTRAVALYNYASASTVTGNIVVSGASAGGSRTIVLTACESTNTLGTEDQQSIRGGAASAPDSGATAATSTAVEAIVGLVGYYRPAGTADGSWTNGFVSIEDAGPAGFRLRMGVQVSSATGTFDAALTGTAPDHWAAIVECST